MVSSKGLSVSRHIVWYIKTWARLLSGFLYNTFREYPVKLKIACLITWTILCKAENCMLDHMNNTFCNTVFRYLWMCLQWLKGLKGRVEFSFLLIDPDLGYWSVIWKVNTTNFIITLILPLTLLLNIILNFIFNRFTFKS